MKTIVIYAFAFLALVNGIHGQSSTDDLEQACTPGSEKKVDCNTCFCANDGTGWSCTRMACPHGGQSSTDDPEQACIPGSEKKVDCNTCFCSNDGAGWSCTRLACPHGEQSSIDDPEQACIPGSEKKVDCNTCFCSNDGAGWSCTRLACPHGGQSSTDDPEQACIPGSEKKVDCNTCFCSNDGAGWSCTRMACPQMPAEFLNPDGSFKFPEQSHPWLRTKRETDEQSSTDGPKQICTPGSQTKVDCNTCTCSNDGTALGCTRMACPQIPAEFLNPDGSLKLPHQNNPLLRTKRETDEQSSTDGPKQICTPGSQTKVDCNTCTCSNDGTALGCTRMACPQIPAEFLNPDGSLKLPHQSNPLLRTKRDQLCVPNSKRTWQCNTCRCNKYGTAEVCTRRICPDLPAQNRPDLQTRCTPNESFMEDCNQCRCSPDGRFAACTLMACSIPSSLLHTNRPHQSNSLLRTKRDQVCEPNTSRMWQCNNCRCTPDGTAEICTRRICPDLPRHRRDAPFSCEPGKNFMMDCNHCFCSPDGRSAGCTMMACLPAGFLQAKTSESIKIET